MHVSVWPACEMTALRLTVTRCSIWMATASVRQPSMEGAQACGSPPTDDSNATVWRQCYEQVQAPCLKGSRHPTREDVCVDVRM